MVVYNSDNPQERVHWRDITGIRWTINLLIFYPQ